MKDFLIGLIIGVVATFFLFAFGTAAVIGHDEFKMRQFTSSGHLYTFKLVK